MWCKWTWPTVPVGEKCPAFLLTWRITPDLFSIWCAGRVFGIRSFVPIRHKWTIYKFFLSKLADENWKTVWCPRKSAYVRSSDHRRAPRGFQIITPNSQGFHQWGKLCRELRLQETTTSCLDEPFPPDLCWNLKFWVIYSPMMTKVVSGVQVSKYQSFSICSALKGWLQSQITDSYMVLLLRFDDICISWLEFSSPCS